MVAMLMQFKNKQRKIASITVSLFMGSWLLLLCQTCFAADNAIKSHSEPSTETSSSCHTPENIALEQTSETNDEHCLGVCDCDAITISFSSDKNSELKEKTKYSTDIYTYVSPEIIISTRAPPGYKVSKTPERAILLPLQTYNVLLI